MKAVLVKGTKISFSIDKNLINDKTPHEENFLYPKGIIDFFQENFEKRKKIIRNNFHSNFEINENEKCEVYVSFNELEQSSLMSFCNTIETPDGGSHENALKNSLIKAIKIFGQKNQLTKCANISLGDI